MPPIPLFVAGATSVFLFVTCGDIFPRRRENLSRPGEVFLKEGGFAARTGSLFEGAVCAADWGSLQLQILAGGGEGRDHLCQLLHHTLVVVLCRSGKLLQLPVELGQIELRGEATKILLCWVRRILSCSSSIISSS